MECLIHLPSPHAKQDAFIHSGAKRVVCRAGRRSGKTVGVSMLAVEKFLSGKRVLYGAPTSEQVERFWVTTSRALEEPIQAGIFKKNETDHVIELPGTEQRIRAKTCWNADTLRGDYCNLLILDEYQLMNEEAWGVVGAPMLLDNNGDAVFIYTPPSPHSRSVSKADDPMHAAKLFKKAQADKTGRWAAFHFTSMDNPYISKAALGEIANDMSNLSYRMEILAEDVDEVPGALWKNSMLDQYRVNVAPTLRRIVVAIDPAVSTNKTSDETGIIAAGKGADNHYYPLADVSGIYSPLEWARKAMFQHDSLNADAIVCETNNGGDLVEANLRAAGFAGRVIKVHASKGKATRAEPIVGLYEQKLVHHVGSLPMLEAQMTTWSPKEDDSPDRVDAMVWALTELSQRGEPRKASQSSYKG
jgi:phage terminase large subunit-like protein